MWALSRRRPRTMREHGQLRSECTGRREQLLKWSDGFAGAKDPKDDINFDPSRPMLPRILEQLREEAEENEAPNKPRRASGLAKMASSPCTFGPDGRAPLPGHLTAALRGLSIEH